MSIRNSGAAGEYRIDADEFARLYKTLADADKTLALSMRKRLRDEAKPLVKKMQGAVKDPTSKRSAKIVQVRRKQRSGEEYQVQTNTADLVARGITFRMATGKTPSARFSASSKNLPAERKPMTRALNKTKFRHPVFARTVRARGIRGLFGKRDTVWVEQAGRPYFGAVILEEQNQLRAAIAQAMEDMAREIDRRT